MKPLDYVARDRVTLTMVTALAIGGVLFVMASLGRRNVPTFAPTAPVPIEVGSTRLGPDTITVDATGEFGWRFFDFSRGSVVETPDPTNWDLAFLRHRIVANGGAGFAGDGGLLELEGADFDSVSRVPATGYVGSPQPGDTTNLAIERWYNYNWTSHLLEPRPTVWAVRTADGRYAKMEILGYYCSGALAGCLTFKFVYQGGGGTDVASP
ncbi:MAG: HmuY family protein [Chloroflexi bacterium]|nr:HmuY family protein [Chloroflexota bacterium]